MRKTQLEFWSESSKYKSAKDQRDKFRVIADFKKGERKAQPTWCVQLHPAQKQVRDGNHLVSSCKTTNQINLDSIF